jgi:hypothetical protein
MADYNLEGLNPRDFQHLVQAIARKNIAVGVTAFGDGRDGNRDLSYDGEMDYPSSSGKWSGYLVLGCKFNQRPTGDSAKDKAWAVKQLESDLKKYLNRRRKLTKPQYYIFVTNLRLSAVPEVGGRAQVTELLENYSPKLGLKDFAIWDYNDLRGFLDGDSDLRSAYGNFVTAGDVLAAMMSNITIDRPDFLDVMHTFLQKELITDMSAKLQSAGEDPEVQIPLANVFVDLPYAESAEAAVLVNEDEEDKLPRVVSTLLDAGGSVLRRVPLSGVEHPGRRRSKTTPSRFVIVGGPGQGKSTFGQYLCQLYRAAMLKNRPSERLDDQVPKILKLLEKQRKDIGGLPLTRRFPIRIELRNFAHALAGDSQLTLLEYIRRDISRLGNSPIHVNDLKAWFEHYPWLLVLDGLDEVPPSSNRSEVLKEINSFRVDAASRNSDMLVVATTRPQSYSKEFSEELFVHLYLTPLSAKQALHYGRKLADARCGADDRRRDELIRSLEKACGNLATSRLMQSPLQVTIMATLLEETGEPPQQKYRLFAEYYRTIYKRETRRKLLGGILSERQKDIDTIHAQAGLLLQAAVEETTRDTRKSSDIDSALSDEQFRTLVKRRLEQIGIGPARVLELLDRISDGSLQRLVFLVRPREGWVRFDIASLKEFMAAEALMNGSDEDIRERMKVIAPASYWRNVFQFAVGKCFVEREHLLDNLVALCSALNEETACEELVRDRTAAQASKAVLWGSRLALDILTDGTARQYPGKEYLFARIALQLVRLPDAEIAARLASVFHEELTDLYIEVVKDRLARANLWEQIGAFQLLTSLADLEVSWAIEMLNAKWPNEAILETAIFVERRDRSLSEWASAKLREILPRINPFSIRPLFVRVDKSFESVGDWDQVFKFIFSRGGGMREEVINRSSWQELWPAFFFTRLHVPSEYAEIVRDKQFEDKAWLPFVAAFRFGANPTCHTLAVELRALAETHEPMRGFELTAIPWPMALCLKFAKTRESLLRIAEAAAQGLLGDTKDWHSAEARWLTRGVTDDDINEAAPSELPFDSRIGSVGFPFSVAEQVIGSVAWVHRIPLYVSRLQQIRSYDTRAYLSGVLVNSALDYSEELSLEEFCELYSLLDQHNLEEPLNLDSLLRSVRTKPAEHWIDTLDLVGRSRFWISTRAAACDVADELIHYLTVQPSEKKGLLRIIAELAKNGCTPQVPKHILDKALRWERPFRQDAIGLSLARLDLKRSEMNFFAKELTGPDFSLWQIWRSLRIMSNTSLSRAAEFGVLLLQHLPENSKQFVDAGNQVRRVLNEFLTNRPSLIQNEDVWKRLHLPEKV